MQWTPISDREEVLCLRLVFLLVQEKLKLITVLGAGLLCGTALAVIIPEGVHALYEEILEGRVPQLRLLLLFKSSMDRKLITVTIIIH